MRLSNVALPSLLYDTYAHHARNLLQTELMHGRENSLSASSLPSVFTDLPTPNRANAPSLKFADATEQAPVGILGAGAGGLYAALILDSLGIPYQLLEARSDVGGRLYTYYFNNTLGAPYNYFDVGAMRFPEIESMRRVFHLFDYPPLNTGDLQLKAKIKPFIFTSNNSFLSYNDVTVKHNDVPAGDPFKASAVIKDTNPNPYIAAGVTAILNDVLGRFAVPLMNDLKTGKTDGWDLMMKYDKHSTRSYMALAYTPSDHLNLPKKPLPTDVINWLETFDKSTGWYDRALTETVLEAIAFGWNPNPNAPPTSWHLIDGGSNKLAQVMKKYILSRRPNAFQFNTWVDYIGIGSDGKSMEVVSKDLFTSKSKTHRFSHVISTIPLPVLRITDLSKAKLSPMQANAIRQLNYGPSVKIGMQFKTAWWTTGENRTHEPLEIVGGASFTDKPLRTVVYPSFGDVYNAKTTTLIASYCWTEDSERLAALITHDFEFKEFVLKDLALIHGVTVEYLRDQLIDTYAWSWTNDIHTMGAFAFFGPGKYKDVYQSLNTFAADGLLHFAGEALSARHAWVEGALDSVWRAVAEMLPFLPGAEKHLTEFYKQWGYNPEWILAQPGSSVPNTREETTTPNPEGPIIPAFEHNLILQNILATRGEYFES
ncbi:hypothetical protein APHAL10511_005838 [Amanita phalloides]|nr:hypothetical protein APHAL10511_005838 [Amanita phalloides]